MNCLTGRFARSITLVSNCILIFSLLLQEACLLLCGSLSAKLFISHFGSYLLFSMCSTCSVHFCAWLQWLPAGGGGVSTWALKQVHFCAKRTSSNVRSANKTMLLAGLHKFIIMFSEFSQHNSTSQHYYRSSAISHGDWEITLYINLSCTYECMLTPLY